MQARIHPRAAAEASWAAPLDLALAGLAPREGVALTASLTDSAGTRWTSHAQFLADDAGHWHPGLPSRAGTWLGADHEGWWWSMRPAGWHGDDRSWLAGALADPTRPLQPTFADDASIPVRFTLVCRGEAGSLTQHRHRLPRGVRSETPAGIAGRAYLPAGPPRAALLLIGGSEGGIQALRAAQLAGHSIAVLAQAWHGWPGRPDAPAHIAIEDFAAGLAWLRQRTGLARPAVWGSSRGSEAALLLADREGQAIAGLILWVPTHLAHGALAPGARDFREETAPMWTIAGQSVPPIRWPGPSPATERARAAALTSLPGWRAAAHYRALWQAPDAEQHRLPTAGIRAPALIVAGAHDGLWPSADGAAAIARALDGQVPVDLAIAPHVGHAIPVPGDPLPFVRTRIWRGQFGIAAGYIDVGGDPAATAAAARASFDRVVRFLTGQPQSAGEGGCTIPPA